MRSSYRNWIFVYISVDRIVSYNNLQFICLKYAQCIFIFDTCSVLQEMSGYMFICSYVEHIVSSQTGLCCSDLHYMLHLEVTVM